MRIGLGITERGCLGQPECAWWFEPIAAATVRRTRAWVIRPVLDEADGLGTTVLYGFVPRRLSVDGLRAWLRWLCWQTTEDEVVWIPDFVGTGRIAAGIFWPEVRRWDRSRIQVIQAYTAWEEEGV